MKEISKKLINLERKDNVFRSGPDQFSIIYGKEDIVDFIKKLDNIFDDFSYIGIDLAKLNTIKIYFNAAVVNFPLNAKSSLELISKAQECLKIAKSKGRNVVRFYDEELQKKNDKILYFEEKIDKAIEKGDFLLYLQPIVDIRSNKIVHAESLIRWKDENGNFIPPSEFIQVAEKTGQIKQIDILMFNKVKAF